MQLDKQLSPPYMGGDYLFTFYNKPNRVYIMVNHFKIPTRSGKYASAIEYIR